MIRYVYEMTMRTVRGVLGMTAQPDGKLGRGVVGRKRAVEELEAWAASHREASRPLVWVHAPSVGEALMAGSIIEALRERRPDCQIAFTFFSPSAERTAGQVPADVATYLPWDIGSEMRRALRALAPRVIAFVRTEVWPTLTHEAKRAGVRVALVNAPLAPGSSRLRPVARRVLRSAYGQLDVLGTVDAADALRFADLGVDERRVRVAGDARFDQVMARVRADTAGTRVPEVLRAAETPVIVAGSIWKEDAERLVPAIAALRSRPLLWVLVPHEPTADHVTELEQALDAHALGHTRIDAAHERGAFSTAVIVDRVGLLADLYAIARVAYVGGGFGRRGLHSVIEPAAHGVPVLAGPNHGNAMEAADLIAVGGGRVAHDTGELVEQITALLEDDRAPGLARTFVTSRLGGAARNAAIIEALLDS
ncbi:MAG: hypothetical protein L0271_10315 [Gemmatimonadetes bacterium]|nr:hypothetical protein [Gemmatimonadota bacterium]